MLERSSWTDTVIWIILFLLLVPSGLVVASWNSLPGSRLYTVKIAMEQAVLALAPTYMAKGELQVAYTERRFSEADQLLTDDQSAEGLAIFKEQALAAQKALQQAPPGEARRQLANKYIASLQSASTKLEQQKQILGGRQQASANVNPRQQNVVVVTQVIQVTQVTQVIQQINQTQTQINTIINTVQNTSNQSDSVSESPTPIPTEMPTATPIPTPEPTPEPTRPPPSMQADFAAPPTTPTDTVAPPTDTPVPTLPPPGNNGNGGDNGNH